MTERRRRQTIAAVVPVTVSQATCLAALGIPPDRFLALVRERSVPHVRLGKSVVCRVEAVLAAFDAASTSPVALATAEPSHEVDDVDTALRRHGLRRAGGAP